MAHTARKRFGQHFLTDRVAIDSIVDAIAPQPGETGLGCDDLPVA